MRPTTAKVVDRAILLVATLCLAAWQYDAPSEDFWSSVLRDRGYLIPLMIVVISVFGAFTPFEAYAEKTRMGRHAAVRQQILAHFGRLLAVAIRAQPPIVIGDLGLHVWRVRRTLRHPLTPRLARVTTYRLGTTPAMRPFSPGKGVGVVGLCWKWNREISVDVTTLSTAVPDEASFAAYREVEGPDAVMGLSWEQFKDVRHRGAVFAAPIRDGQQTFAGCVSVDAGHGYASLNDDALWHEMNSLCVMLGRDGFRDL
jgi:hypothetical protein